MKPSDTNSDETTRSIVTDWVVGDGMVAQLDERVALKLRQRRRRRVTSGLASVAVIAIAVLVVKPWQSEPIPTASLAFNVTAPARQVLPDGSVVEHRNRHATVQVSFTATERRVVLEQGEAHFDVRKDSSRPFIVTAHGVDFRAVGTAFSIAVAAGKVDLVVTEGTVAVQRTNRASNAEEPLVTAGQGMSVSIADSSALPSATPLPETVMHQRLSWRVPRVEFTRARLADVIACFREHAHVSIELGDASMADLELSGFLRADNVDALLQLLEADYQISATRTGDRIRLAR